MFSNLSWRWGLFGLVIVMVVAIEFLITGLLRTQNQKLLRELDHIRSESALYREMGYGGIIHNFKNYVLRDEEIYAERVALLAQQIDTRIETLNAAASEFGLDIEYRLTQQMIDAYLERVSVVEEMRANGQTAQQIDQVVRYDDSTALAEVFENELVISNRIESDLIAVQTISFVQTLLTTILSVLALILITLLLEKRRHNDIKKLSAMYNQNISKSPGRL